MGDIFEVKRNLQYRLPLDYIFNDNSQNQNKIGLLQNEIDNVKSTIIKIIQHLITSSSIVKEVEEFYLGNIAGRPYKLFIKQEGDIFKIHPTIGHLEEKK